MKQVVIQAPHGLAVVETEVADPGPAEVLLRVKSIGICGSDLHTFEGQHPFVSYPVWPGHELVGVIEELGQGVDASLIGREVALEPSLVDHSCRNCAAGRYNICENLQVMGFQVPGGMAEKFVAPTDRLHILPSGFGTDRGVLVEPTAVAVHAARLPGSLAGCEVAVIGAGTIGLLVAQVARAFGARRVFVAELEPPRRKLPQDLGFEVGDKPPERAFDVIFECVGVEAALRNAISSARKGAAVVVVGVFGREVCIPMGLVQDWELRLLGALMYTGTDYQEAIDLLASSNIEVGRMITHRYPLTDVNEAFAQASRRGSTLKVVLETSP